MVVVHGGAGNPKPERLRHEAPIRAALTQAVEAALAAAPHGALAAAVAAVEVLEDDPLFNAGRGSVPTSEGHVEMDAAVMCGRSGCAGAVACVKTVRHPIALARAVLEESGQVMLIGAGAEALAAKRDFERRPPAWFLTREPDVASPGTVGAVVLDDTGALAAATSTGGRKGQPPGRVGDTPVIGAGTYADSRRAISMTGDGERILERVSAHSIARSPDGLHGACDLALRALTPAEAGLIAVDVSGTIAMPFNTRVMHRGWSRGGRIETAIV